MSTAGLRAGSAGRLMLRLRNGLDRIREILTKPVVETQSGWPGVVAIGLAAIVFLLDLHLPTSIAVHALYVGPIVISLWSGRVQHTLLAANLCTAFIAIALYFSSPDIALWNDTVNRLLSLYAIWIVTLSTLFRKRTERTLAESNRNLIAFARLRDAEISRTNAEFKKEITDRKRAEESLRHLSGALLHMQDEERRRIARELHDTTAQSLAAIALNLTRLEKMIPTENPKASDVLADTIALAVETSREIRTLSYLLHPPLLEEAGLASAVRWYADGFSQRSGIQITLDVPSQFDRLPVDVETTLFRIVQESLTNISRHSQSQTAKIRILRNPGEIMLEVQDEGRGIPPEKLERVDGNISGLGVGIAGIWERVRQFEGELDINSGSHGTTVTVVLPLKEEVT